MHDGWDEVRLGDIVTFLSGGTPKKDEDLYWSGEIPWISGATLTDRRLHSSDRRLTPLGVENGSRIAPAGATLILVRGMSLLDEIRVGQAMRDLAFNQDVKALVPGPGTDAGFLTYALLARRPELLRMVHQAGHGTGVLATDLLRALTITLPPIQEQRQITSVLGVLDDLIDTNRDLSDRLRRGAAASYSLALKSGFDEVALGECARFYNHERIPLSKAERSAMPGPYPYYGATGIVDTVGRYLFDAVHILVGEDGSVIQDDGSPVVQTVWGKYWVNNHAHVLSGVGISNGLLRQALLASNVAPLVTGAVQAKLSMGRLKMLRLRLPSSAKGLSTRIDELAAAERELSEEIVALTRTRDELLPLLLSGRVRVDGLAA